MDGNETCSDRTFTSNLINTCCFLKKRLPVRKKVHASPKSLECFVFDKPIKVEIVFRLCPVAHMARRMRHDDGVVGHERF